MKSGAILIFFIFSGLTLLQTTPIFGAVQTQVREREASDPRCPWCHEHKSEDDDCKWIACPTCAAPNHATCLAEETMANQICAGCKRSITGEVQTAVKTIELHGLLRETYEETKKLSTKKRMQLVREYARRLKEELHSERPDSALIQKLIAKAYFASVILKFPKIIPPTIGIYFPLIIILSGPLDAHLKPLLGSTMLFILVMSGITLFQAADSALFHLWNEPRSRRNKEKFLGDLMLGIIHPSNSMIPGLEVDSRNLGKIRWPWAIQKTSFRRKVWNAFVQELGDDTSTLKLKLERVDCYDALHEEISKIR